MWPGYNFSSRIRKDFRNNLDLELDQKYNFSKLSGSAPNQEWKILVLSIPL